MTDIGKTELILRKIYKCFKIYEQTDERPHNINIVGLPILQDVIAEVNATPITPQLNKIEKLCNIIIQRWNESVFNLPQDGYTECLLLEGEIVWRRINSHTYTVEDWEDENPNYRNYYYDTLMQIISDIGGYIKQKKELENPTPKQPEAEEIPDFQPLSDKILKDTFKVLKVAEFKVIEGRLYNRGYLDKGRLWHGKKLEIVAFIGVLMDNQFFKNSVSDNDAKNFFQSLYQIDIRQQFKPSKREKAERYKPIFSGML